MKSIGFRKIDSKGRLAIPVDIAKIAGLGKGTMVELLFDIDNGLLVRPTDESADSESDIVARAIQVLENMGEEVPECLRNSL